MPGAQRRLSVLTAIGLTFAAAACATSPPSDTSPIAPPLSTAVPVFTTPDADPTGAPTETPTPSPTATPTPTPLPAVRLGDAARHMRNGDFESAIAEYGAILDDGGAASEVEAALFGAGVASLRAGDLVAAENMLGQFIDRYPDSALLGDAWFLLGDARHASGNFTGAVDAYREYLDLRGSVIGSYVQERIGDALNQAGDTEAAVVAYREAIAAAPNNPVAARQREKLALVYRLRGDYDDAIAQYRAILGFAQIDAYRAGVLLQLGQTLIDSGDAAGYDVFADLVSTYPKTDSAYQALVALVGNGIPVDFFQRGLVDYYARQYDAAVAALGEFIDSVEDHADAHYYMAMSHRAAGNTRAAIQQFDALIEDHPQSPLWAQAWIDKAIAQSQGDDLEGAAATLTKFAEDTPRDALAPNALQLAGILLERAGEFDRAAEVFRSLQESYPSHTLAPDALFGAGVNAYRAGRAEPAVEAWRVLSDTYPTADRYPAALLWQGKLAQHGGDARGRTLLDLAARAKPYGYYGIRAAELRDDRPTLQPVPFDLEFDEAAERAEAEAWLAEWTGREDAAGIGALPESILEDGRFRRGDELWRLGWVDEARSEFDDLRAAHNDDPVALYALSLYWRDIGLYRSSLIAAARLIAISPAKTPDNAPAFVARLSYPTYYADLVVPEAEQHGLDPLLVFALIRQESLFEGIAVSRAFANGLMQIIPSTGEFIASRLGWPDYSTADLYKPTVNVTFGTWYLANVRDGFDGDVYAALAGYNGGPGNAQRWRDAAKGDPDLFLETITLDETRAYLLRVREHLAIYQKLYGVSDP
ncbi:MAG TPA: tetratricopeptide repeat protein [Anaerolineae bacterium]|nr:tetratricopeptide repeat protein [Anaerolineae bacterium]